MEIKELNEFMSDHGFCNTNNEEDLPKKYVCDLVESALKEGRKIAIDEFAEAMKKKTEHYEFANFLESSWSHAWAILHFKSCVDEIAKELKGE